MTNAPDDMLDLEDALIAVREAAGDQRRDKPKPKDNLDALVNHDSLERAAIVPSEIDFLTPTNSIVAEDYTRRKITFDGSIIEVFGHSELSDPEVMLALLEGYRRK